MHVRSDFCIIWVYSSAVEQLTTDQQVPGSNPGAPFFLLALHAQFPFCSLRHDRRDGRHLSLCSLRHDRRDGQRLMECCRIDKRAPDCVSCLNSEWIDQVPV